MTLMPEQLAIQAKAYEFSGIRTLAALTQQAYQQACVLRDLRAWLIEHSRQMYAQGEADNREGNHLAAVSFGYVVAYEAVVAELDRLEARR